MTDHLRRYFGLTQEMLASWLGIARASLALAERNHQPLPSHNPAQLARIVLAMSGTVYNPAGAYPGPAPAPAPLPEPEPLAQRLDYCRHHAQRLCYALKALQSKAAAYEARLAALPALRAWTGPVADPGREENWLAWFEAEAREALANNCGAGPQGLLQARIAGLEREAELLTELLAAAARAGSQAPG